jgi:hypothetical protein
MIELKIFEPAMCCETGVCGVDADTVLITFSADIEWLRKQGGLVQRFNLAQEPSAFISDPLVKTEINENGESCLPLFVLDGEVISRGKYPDRAQLQLLTGIGSSSQPSESNSKPEVGCCVGSDCC